jgi:hypothetical protein
VRIVEALKECEGAEIVIASEVKQSSKNGLEKSATLRKGEALTWQSHLNFLSDCFIILLREIATLISFARNDDYLYLSINYS